MKIYKLLLSVIMPFWNFASEVNLPNAKKPEHIICKDLEIRNISLYEACKEGNLESLEYIISQGVDINAEDIMYLGLFGYMSPLGVASAYGHLEIVKCLISHNANINTRSIDEWPPLYMAIENGHLEVVKYLISQGVIIIVPAANKGPLHIACWFGRLEVLKYLVSCKCNINELDAGETPFHIACELGYLGIAKYLISQKVDINILNNQHQTALHLACKYFKIKVAKYLISQNANINALDNQGETALHIACKNIGGLQSDGKLEVVKCLISQGANINAKNYNGETALQVAFKYGNLDVAEYLRDYTGLSLLQQGIDHEYGNKIFTVFSELFELENSDEASPLCKFNLIKRKAKELILISNWEEILRIQTLRLRPDEKDKLVKPFISVFFTPCQIFQLIYDQYKAIPNTDEMKKIIKVVSIEYNLTKVTSESNLNLLHIFASNVDICNFVVSINPKLITMKHSNGNMPCLEAFYKNFKVKLFHANIAIK